MSLFGSSGIRGKVGEDFTVELAIKIGSAIGSLNKDVVLAKDVRTSGDMMVQAIISGITSCGGNVHYAGMASTPTLARATSAFDCGIMVTASHNPPQYNGAKIWNPDGSAYGSEQMDAVEGRILSCTFERKDWRHVGGYDIVEKAVQDHIDAVVRSVKYAHIKLVLDCGNGATCNVSPYVLRKLGNETTTINCQPDGHFPGRSSEPTEEALTDLKKMVISKGAELGIAHDGDGDRMVAVDDNGRFIDGDRLLALFASELHVKSVVAPMDASMVLNDIVRTVHRSKVGDVYVAEALKITGADLGGEPSGTYIFPKETLCPDGVYAAAVLSMIASERKISEIIDALPSYPVERRSYVFENGRRTEVERALSDTMSGVDCDRLLTLDGFRAETDDGWFLIRLSGTEPKVRIVAEARDKDSMIKKFLQADNVVRKCIE